MPPQLPTAGRIGGDLRDAHHELARLLAGADLRGTVSIEQKKRRIQALFDHVRAVEQLIPRDTFDLGAVAAQIGTEPSRFHQWVREKTMWIPYRGSLRGARGTLIDRRGNSLDRALLLAGLLIEVGVPVRLARAQLTPEQAAELRQSRVSPATKDTDLPDSTARISAAVDDYAKQTGLNAGVILKQLQRTVEVSQVASESVLRRAEVQTSMLVKGLGLQTPESTSDWTAAEMESLSDHWWVQYQNDADWRDLDPALAKPGGIIETAQETMDVDSLPEDLRHVLHIRVIVEKWDGSTLEEQPVVTADIVPSLVIGDSIRLQHLPMAWPKSLDGSVAEASKRFKTAALDQHEWLPVLTIGDRRITEASILDTGDVNAQPGSKPGVAAAAAGVLDAFGGGNSTPGVLTGEWIEYEIQAPGRESRIIRREVFDLVGPSARAAGRGPRTLTDGLRLLRGLSLLGETEILPLPCQLSAAFVTHLAASRFLAAESTVMNLLDGSGQFDQLRNLAQLPTLLHAFAAARGSVSRRAGSLYIPALNVLSRHTFPVPTPTNTINIGDAIDIVSNEVASSATTRSEQFEARVEQGVLDANLEAALTGSPAPSETTADLFGVSEAGRRWMAVRTIQDLRGLVVPADVRSRIEAEVRAGFAVLALTAAGPADPVAWWRVDPRTGATLSFGHRGWGQAMVEYKIVAASVGTFSICSLGAYVANGQYTDRDRVICVLAGLATLAGGVPVTGVRFYSATLNVGGVQFITGTTIMSAAAAFVGVMADALGLHW